MKVKLLKKIRKRHSIYRVNKMSKFDDDTNYLYDVLVGQEFLFQPFYIVQYDSYVRQWRRPFKTEQDAKDYILSSIVKIYGPKIKSNKSELTKVWWK